MVRFFLRSAPHFSQLQAKDWVHPRSQFHSGSSRPMRALPRSSRYCPAIILDGYMPEQPGRSCGPKSRPASPIVVTMGQYRAIL